MNINIIIAAMYFDPIRKRPEFYAKKRTIKRWKFHDDGMMLYFLKGFKFNQQVAMDVISLVDYYNNHSKIFKRASYVPLSELDLIIRKSFYDK